MSNVKQTDMMNRPRRDSIEAGDTFEKYDGGYDVVMELNKSSEPIKHRATVKASHKSVLTQEENGRSLSMGAMAEMDMDE